MQTTDRPQKGFISDLEWEQLRLGEVWERTRSELRNLLEINAPLVPKPNDIPKVKGIDIFGESIQANGPLGGDHIIFLDFKRRYDLGQRIKRAEKTGKESVRKQLELSSKKAGILVADVAGHSFTDAALTGRLHEAFLLGVLYELDLYGTITERLFETLNISLYNSTSDDKLITMIYGEVCEEGTFKFISAAHPTPIVFSNEFDRIVDISPDRFAIFPPLGSEPPEYHIDKRTIRGDALGYKKKYRVNEINLMGKGDIMVIYTDGLSDFENDRGEPFLACLEEKLKSLKHLPAMEIGWEIKDSLAAFGKQTDDISYVIVKKTQASVVGVPAAPLACAA